MKGGRQEGWFEEEEEAEGRRGARRACDVKVKRTTEAAWQRQQDEGRLRTEEASELCNTILVPFSRLLVLPDRHEPLPVVCGVLLGPRVGYEVAQQ